MRFVLFFIVLILFSFDSIAYWPTFQNDLRNTGSANGTGYFPLETANFSDNSLGMDFQPLVADLNADGKNEIVIFSNDSLIVFNPQLSILTQTKVGPILGQPALFDFDSDNLVEIIFNARQNATDYFFAYQYGNSNLQQEFNITLPNEANFSGIKCLNLDNINSCVFKDKRNYIHIVNMDSKTDNYYNTSVYNESRQIVSAIGDIDNDGNTDAVFWFDNDSGNGYGFLAFDLSQRKVKWVVDNIFSPSVSGSGAYNFFLKGQPVLVDLNNDNKLEVAGSVFYDDSFFTGGLRTDWFTELHVYNPNGTKLFSVCELGATNCNDIISTNSVWEGTNPFVLDYDKNGIDDICFIKDKKKNGFFKNMTINCYNYLGNALSDAELSPSVGAVKAAAVADINNDGIKEIITEDTIYSLDGHAMLSYNFGNSFVIPVDIDGNKGLDLIWTRVNKTKVLLDNYNYTNDLSVSSADIIFLKFNQTFINVSAVIKNNGQAEADNVKAIVYDMDTLENKAFLFNARRNANTTISALLELREGDKVLVSVDYDNEINETDETNNFAIKEFIGLPYVFVSIDNFEPFNVQSEFKDYIKNKLISGYYTENENEADIKVYIGKNNPRNKDNNIKTLNDFEFGYDFGNILYNDLAGTLPYNGLVGAFKDDNGKTNVMIVGNEIDGDIAAAKEFIKNQALFLSTQDKNSVFVDDENADAVKVYDYLHLGGNQEHYGINDGEFRKIVKNALNDEMFNVEDKTVTTSNGITLRLRNLKPNISSDYLEYLNSTGMPVEMPVVLAHGLFSNLTTWEGLGSEISNTGRDTWLIEITGGPSQDCNDCIDYTFYNLTDIFVPALLNGVLSFTGKDKLQYVGFSNGCRAALDSLERNQFDSNKVETFVAVGCPGAFEKNNEANSVSFVAEKLKKDGEDTTKFFENKNKKHLSQKELIERFLGIPFINGDGKISLILFKQYVNWTIDSEDKEPGKNLNLNNFALLQGSFTGFDDLVVSIQDELNIYNNIQSNNKKYLSITVSHINLDIDNRAKSLIKKMINKQQLNTFEKLFYLLNSTTQS